MATSQETPPSTPFPIDRCLPEIFELILQSVVDHEASQYPPHIAHYKVKPKAAVQLALVCKSWKEIVYNTPSLWPVIPLNLMAPIERVKRRYNRVIARAKGAPVDLYLFYVHTHGPEYDASHSSATCPSNKENLTYFFNHIPNIRKLQVVGMQFELPLILDGTPSGLAPVQDLVYFCPSPMSMSASKLTQFMSGMPYLHRLHLHDVGSIRLPFRTNTALLPYLRTLEVHSSGLKPVLNDAIPSILSHTPNLEFLDCWIPVLHTDQLFYSYEPFILPYLRRIVTHNLSMFIPAFTSRIIQTPALRNLHILEWRNEINHDVHEFFKLNPTITELRITATDTSLYGEALGALEKLDVLTLSCIGEGSYLNPLLARATDGLLPERLPVLPRYLGLLRLNITRSPTLEYFESMVTSRCIPVTQNGLTESGCSPTVLEITTSVRAGPYSLLMGIRDGVLWKAAEVTKKGERSIQLRWAPPQ